MKNIKLIALAVAILVSATCCWPQCSNRTSGKNKFVAITPYSGLDFLPDKAPFAVKEFVNLKSKKDYSRLFGIDAKMGPFTVEHVPYGTYRIKIQYGSEVFGRLIDVCDQYESVDVPNHFARISIVLLNTTLSAVKEDNASVIRVDSFRNVDGTEMKSLFKGAVADGVPYGSYDLVLFHPWGGTFRRRVDVYQEDVRVYSGILGVEFGETMFSAPENVVRGEIENIPEIERPIFVTLTGIYAPFMSNGTVVDSGGGTGAFNLNGVNPYGEFMLYTIGRSGVLDAREIKTSRESKVIIDLSHPNPPKKDDP